MREILFRGKRTDNGEWIYGSFTMDALEQKNGLCGMDGFIRLYDFDKRKMQTDEVDRDTVGQYTGLKDKNGKRIFEGDILEDDGGILQQQEIYVVLFERSSFGTRKYKPKKEDWINPFDDNEYGTIAEFCKVIGNIYDNPELLEG